MLRVVPAGRAPDTTAKPGAAPSVASSVMEYATDCEVFANADAVVQAGLVATRRLKTRSEYASMPVARTVHDTVLATLGVPLRRPLDDSVIPDGSAPLCTAKVVTPSMVGATSWKDHGSLLAMSVSADGVDHTGVATTCWLNVRSM